MRFTPLALVVASCTLATAQTTAPVLASLSPGAAIAGGPAFTLSLTGSNFAPNAVVVWNASLTLTTTFFSSSQLSASVPASFIATPGFVVVQVQNPDGTRSNALPFNITAPPVSITTEAITAAVVGTQYFFTLAASGGSPPYAWTLASGSLPPGLTLNPSGAITGTPTLAGSFTFVVRVTDRLQAAATRSLQLTVNPPPFSILTNSPLPAGTVGVAYTQQFSLTGGTPPYRWSATGAPPGLTMDAALGILRGTPTANGTFTFTVQVADNAGLSASKTFSVAISPPPLVISTDAVFSGTVGLAYSQTFSATGGIPPYRWALVAGSPGGGLTFDAAAATITGTPQATGSFPFTIQVTDSVGVTASKSYTLVVEAPRLNILTASPLANGMVGSPYLQRFTAVGGTSPYAWSAAGGVPGLTLDASGTLSGTPTLSGSFSFTVTVRDAAGITASRTFALTINPSPLSIATPRDLAPAVVGAPVSVQFEAAGGLPPYTWAANGLPDGLSLDAATGLLSGSPNTPGTLSFTVRVTDSARATVVDLFRIAVNVPPIPTLMLSGLASTVDAAAQPVIRLSLASPFPVELAGQLVLSFVPDSGGGDNTIQFSTGGRSASFRIPAESTAASFPVPELALQTGTVAGSIRVSVQLQAGDIDVTPNPPPSFSARVERAAPVIRRVAFTRSASTITVQVTGFTTAREITEAVFRFAATGATLQTPELRIPVENLFSPWFQDPNSSRFGSQFTFSQQFTVQGDANALTLESVTLSNRLGSANARP